MIGRRGAALAARTLGSSGTLATVGLCVLALLAGCAPKVRDRGLQPAASTAQALQAALAPRRVALIVGIDRYDDALITPLRHAGADARAIADVLRATDGGFDEVVVLTARDDTGRARVISELRRLRATLRHEDQLVVYFSGHGTRVRADDGWRRFLLVADTEAADLGGTAMELGALQEWFASVPSARKALMVDACFSGDGRSALGAPPEEGEASGSLVPRMTALGSGEAHLYATSAGRPSREDDRLGHGVYTWYVLEAMTTAFDRADRDRDGVLTAWEAHDHARGLTIEHTGGAQVPEAAFRVLGEADLVLAGDPGRRRAREQALFYLYTGDNDAMASASIIVDGRDRGAFPGTVPLEPGRHHVVLEGADGRVLLDGQATFRAGRAYRADDIQRIVQGPKRQLGARAAYTSGASMPQILGAGALGAEVWGQARFARGPLHGLYGDGFLGGAVAPWRDAGEHGTLAAPRSLGQAGAGLGLQGDLGQLRLRGGWGASAVYIPPSYPSGRPDDGVARAWEAGWWFGATGPTVGVGYALRGPWTLTAQGRLHATRLDPWRTGHLETVVLGTAGFGVEASY